VQTGINEKQSRYNMITLKYELVSLLQDANDVKIARND